MKDISNSLTSWVINNDDVVAGLPSAGNALPDLVLEIGVPFSFDTRVDFSGAITGYSLAPSSNALPAGVTYVNGILSGTPSSITGATILIYRATDGTNVADSAHTVSVVDTQPDAFNFTDQADLALDALTTSEAITLTGYTAAASVSVTGCEYQVLDAADQVMIAWTTADGSISPTQKLQVRRAASSEYSTSLNSTISVGGTVDTWTITTAAAADTTPDSFAFNDLTGQALNSPITSNILVLTGFDTASPVSITGGEYRIYDASDNVIQDWTSSPGTYNPGEKLQLRVTSAATNGVTVNVVPNVGGVTDTWSVTTVTVPANYPVYRVGDTVTVAGAGQWQANGVDIPGETGDSFTPLVGHTYQKITNTQDATGFYVLPALAAPSHSVTIDGTNEVGEVLRADVTATGWPYPAVTLNAKVNGVAAGDTRSLDMRVPDQVGDLVSFDTVADSIAGTDNVITNGTNIAAQATGPHAHGVDDPALATNLSSLASQEANHPFLNILNSGSLKDWNPISMSITADLTGPAVTQIPTDGIDANIPQTGWVVFASGAAYRYTAHDGTNFTIPSTDFSYRPELTGNTVQYPIDHQNLILGGYCDAQGNLVTAWPGITLKRHWFNSSFVGKTFVARWTGSGGPSIGGGCTLVSSSAGRLVFTATAASFWLNDAPGYANFSVVEEQYEALYDAGERFTPYFVSQYGDLRQLRFMDIMRINGNPVENWADRAAYPATSYADGFGIPPELAVDIANRLKCDAWINIPHRATNDYVTQLATYVRDNLDAGLKAVFAYANELWNEPSFGGNKGQVTYCRHLAYDVYGWSTSSTGSSGPASDFELVLNAYARRMTECFYLIDQVYSGSGRPYGKVGETQMGNPWVTPRILNAEVWANQTNPYYSDSLGVTLGRPATYYTEVAATLYFGRTLFDNPFSRQAAFQAAYDAGQANEYMFSELVNPAFTYNVFWTFTQLQAHKSYLAADSLDLVCYEGGIHVVQFANTSALQADTTLLQAAIDFSGSQECTEIYSILWDLWKTVGDGPFMQFQWDVIDSEYGTWGPISDGTMKPYGRMLKVKSGEGNWWGAAATGYQHDNVLFTPAAAGALSVLYDDLITTLGVTMPQNQNQAPIANQMATIVACFWENNTDLTVTVGGVAVDPLNVVSVYADQDGALLFNVGLFPINDASAAVAINQPGYSNAFKAGAIQVAGAQISLPGVGQVDVPVITGSGQTVTLPSIAHSDNSLVVMVSNGVEDVTVPGFTKLVGAALPSGKQAGIYVQLMSAAGNVAPSVTIGAGVTSYGLAAVAFDAV